MLVILIAGCAKQHAPESAPSTTQPSTTQPSETPETTPQQTEPETPKQEELGFWQKIDSAEVLPSKTLNVKGYRSTACFLGSLAMLLHYDNSTITFEKMLEMAQIVYEPGTGGAVERNEEKKKKCDEKQVPQDITEPETEEVANDYKKNGVMMVPQDIIDVISDLGYKLYIGYTTPAIKPLQHLWLSKVPSEQVKEFSSEQEAESYLKKAISSGYLPMVTVEYNYIIKYLVPNHMDVHHADHYMVVVGYDKNYFYLNDPIPETEDPPPIVEKQKIPKDKFLQAWGNTLKTGPRIMIIQKKD